MKKTFKLLASLTLGLMVASCQNGLEEVMEQSAVQDELATTRADYEEPINDVEYVSLTEANNIIINGPNIMSGSTQYVFEVSSIVSGTNLEWSFNHNHLDSITHTTAGITLRLKNALSTTDTYITALFKDPSTGETVHYVTKYIGANGPRSSNCSIRVVRYSDLVEAYPSPYGLRPNTWYNGYFTTTELVSLSLRWEFIYSSCSNPIGTPVYFHSGANGYDLVKVYGTLPGSYVEKKLVDVTLYGGSDYNSPNDKGTNEEIEDEIEIVSE